MLLGKFLDPKNDVAFKKIFGTEKNKDILIHFLNDVLTFKGHGHIVEVSFLKTIQDPETAAKKTSIVDILCKDQNGNTYIVEMQVAKEKGFEKRAQYYASKAYVSQVNIGGEYHNLKEIIFLAISDFIMFPSKKVYKSDHVILDKESLENDLKDFSFTFIELPKFDKDIDHLEKWTYFFKHAEETSEKDLRKLIGHDQIIERAFDELDRFSWNDEEIRTYDQAEKYEGAYRASMAQKFDEGEKVGIEKGEKIGIEKGEKMGIEKGEKVGIEKGIAREKIAMAHKMIKKGLDSDAIRELTGLSFDEIQSLM